MHVYINAGICVSIYIYIYIYVCVCAYGTCYRCTSRFLFNASHIIFPQYFSPVRKYLAYVLWRMLQNIYM